MPAPSTIECDIKPVGDLAMIALDEGVKVEVLYWTIHKKVACVVSAQGVKGFALEVTPAKAIKAAADKIFGGL